MLSFHMGKKECKMKSVIEGNEVDPFNNDVIRGKALWKPLVKTYRRYTTHF